MSSSDDRIKSLSEQESEKLLGKESFRSRINEIITEYVDKVDFMKKVKEYSGEEIDRRLFVSFRYYITAAVTGVISVAVVKIVEKLFAK